MTDQNYPKNHPQNYPPKKQTPNTHISKQTGSPTPNSNTGFHTAVPSNFNTMERAKLTRNQIQEPGQVPAPSNTQKFPNQPTGFHSTSSGFHRDTSGFKAIIVEASTENLTSIHARLINGASGFFGGATVGIILGFLNAILEGVGLLAYLGTVLEIALWLGAFIGFIAALRPKEFEKIFVRIKERLE